MNKSINVPLTDVNCLPVPEDYKGIHLQFSADDTEVGIDTFIQQEKWCA